MGSQAREVVAISIHALREEGDFWRRRSWNTFV